MTRDMDLVRSIMLEIEEHQDPGSPVRLKAEGYSPEQVAGHVRLLVEAGLIDAVNFSTLGRVDWRPKTLTWAGHEFLDATRNNTVWQKVKAEIKDRGVTLPFQLIQELAMRVAAKVYDLDNQ